MEKKMIDKTVWLAVGFTVFQAANLVAIVKFICPECGSMPYTSYWAIYGFALLMYLFAFSVALGVFFILKNEK